MKNEHMSSARTRTTPYLLTILFSPSKDTTGFLAHDLLKVLSVEPPCLRPILIAIFKVDTVLPEEVPTLLLIIYGTISVSTFYLFSCLSGQEADIHDVS